MRCVPCVPVLAIVLLVLSGPVHAGPDASPLEALSALAMETPYDGFTIDNADETLAAFKRLSVTFAGEPADGLAVRLDNWKRLEWMLPTPNGGDYVVSLLFQSGVERLGRFGCVLGGEEFVSEPFNLPAYKWGHGMRAFRVRVPTGQPATRMFVSGKGLYIRRVAFSRVTRPIRYADGRLTRLAPSSYRTVVRRRAEQGGQPSCVVLVPPGAAEADLARKLAQRLRIPARTEPEPGRPFPAYPVADGAGPDTNLILVVGERGGPLLRAMARAGIADGRPSSAWRIRTVARPFRGEANVIVIGGCDGPSLARACEAFAGLVRETDGERVFDKFLTLAPDPAAGGVPVHVRDARAPDDPWWQKYEDNLAKPLAGINWSTPARGFQSFVGKLAAGYWTTGNERYAELCRKYLFKMVQDRAYTTYGGGDDAHMALSTLMRAWDRVEEAAAFSEADRLRIVNYLLDCLASDQGFPRDGGVSHYGGRIRMRHNHQTILGQGLMAAYLYFSRLYELGLADWWKAGCDVLIENGTGWGHAPEDSALYEPGTFREVAEMLHYQGLSTRGAKGTELWPETLTRFLAAVDSFGFPAPYGDCWASFQLTATSFFDVMAEDWHWPAQQFLTDHRIRGFRHARPSDDMASEQRLLRSGSTDIGGTQPPSDPRAVAEALKPLLGLAALPMGRGYYDYMAGTIGNDEAWQKHAKPPVPPYERTADKIQYRSGWGPEHEYLLFETLGWSNHGHMDLGALIHYCAGGRLWIVDSGYKNNGPEHHSMLDLSRDGERAWRKRPNAGALAWSGFLCEGQQLMEVVRLEPSRPGGPGPFRFTCRVNDYAGARWERTVSGGAGKGLQVEDVVTAEKAGTYDAVFRLRFLGALQGEAGRWAVRQKGAVLPVMLGTLAGDRLATSEFQPDKQSSHHTGLYPGYAFIDDPEGKPITLEWRRTVTLRAGQPTVFRAALGPPAKP
ncbi:MAG: hypothetical protein JXR37_05580 [Kiritimatiellae bacterium]|nr:hypothetical protein [Kiritimatiellia bacterium]